MGLRPYQARGIEAIRKRLHSGMQRILAVAPTGAGKTLIAANMMQSANDQRKRLIFLAHRAELLDQTSRKLAEFHIPHGVLQRGHPLSDERTKKQHDVQVASIPTLVARRGRGEAVPPADIAFLDEAHHSEADTFKDLIDVYPGIPVIGLTATPWRSDGRGFDDTWEDLVLIARVRELIDAGYLADFHGFSYQDPDLDLDSLPRTEAGEINAAAYARRAMKSRVMGDVVARYLEHAKGKRAAVFACTRAHALALLEKFRAAGIPSEHVDGTMSREERAAVIARVRSGETLIVTNVNLLTEGVDIPELEVCILARPTLSTSLYIQIVGRVLRPCLATGKTFARIHDHVGAMLIHGLPDLDREYTLKAAAPVRLDGEPRVAVCTKCGCAYSVGSMGCPACRKIEGGNERLIPAATTEGQMVLVQELREATLEKRRAEYLQLQTLGQQTGEAPGWAARQFKMRYGVNPDWRWLRDSVPR